MRFEDMKKALVEAAQQAGLEQYEIYFEQEESIGVETLKQEISSFSSGVGGGVCFRCIVDGKMGYASGESMTEADLKELVTRAISNARCIDSEDEAVIFSGSEAYRKTEQGEVTLADPAELTRTALELQAMAYAESDKVGDGTQTYLMSGVSEVRLYNSYGLELSNRVGRTAAYLSAVVREGDEAQEDDASGLGSTTEALRELPQKAVKGALSKLGAVTIPSGKYAVVFRGEQFRNFLSVFSDAFSAKQAQLGLSLLAGKEGETVAAECITITDDPMREGHGMQAPFDGEGVATYKKHVVEGGVLRTLLYDLSTAARAGTSSTGNGQKRGYASAVSIAPYSFSIEAGDTPEEELLRQAEGGILITECKGFHAGANAVTGDFSIESAGFRIRDGKRGEPIKSFTVAGNFFALLKEIARVGDEVRWSPLGGFTTFGSPDVLVMSMSVAGS